MTYIYTSCAANYVPKAKILVDSLKKNVKVKFKCCLACSDKVNNKSDKEYIEDIFDEVFFVEDIKELNIGKIFEHNIVELSTLIKPFILKRLLEKDDCENVIYFDPDIAVFNNVQYILDLFKNDSILLTPHITTPEKNKTGVLDNEIAALKHGAYNFGFYGIKNNEIGKSYANWWSSRLLISCKDDIPNGVFTDQKWNDLVPCMFEEVKIIKHEGCNTASWNISNRRVSKYKNKYIVNDKNLIFFHFTGFDSGKGQVMMEKYSNDNKHLKNLFSWYLKEIKKNECDLISLDWYYGKFTNGEKISSDARIIYTANIDLKESFDNPFNSELKNKKFDISFFDWFKNYQKSLENKQKKIVLTDNLFINHPTKKRPLLFKIIKYLFNKNYRNIINLNLNKIFYEKGIVGLLKCL